MARNEATQRQIDAAHPGRSTWLSANAGSGKTRVLTDRVARLLLDKVEPQNILCLTYTKAAASEMQNRLFRRLGEWAMLPDAALTRQLDELGYAGTIDGAALRDARRLFACAIETPGGLKIQTIHSFCAGLLRRFPLEAGVSPQFTEMEDRTASLLRAEIVDQIATGPDAPALRAIARHHGGETLDDLTSEIVRQRSLFDSPRKMRRSLPSSTSPPPFRRKRSPPASFWAVNARCLTGSFPPFWPAERTIPRQARSCRQSARSTSRRCPCLKTSF